MAIQDPPTRPEPTPPRSRRERFLGWFNAKKKLNRWAVKALEAADDVLASIPIAQVASEIKDVALTAIKD